MTNEVELHRFACCDCLKLAYVPMDYIELPPGWELVKGKPYVRCPDCIKHRKDTQ